MEIYERIKLLRKNHLNMSQEKFGEELGVNRIGITNIEGNRLVKPEQKEPLYRLICKTFNVSYEWLTTGEGEMFTESKQSFVDRFAAEAGLGFYAKKIMESYLNLDAGQRQVIEVFFKNLAEACAVAPSADSVDVDDVYDNTVQLYRAARSVDNTEHQIIPDTDGKIERFKKLPKVTDASDL